MEEMTVVMVVMKNIAAYFQIQIFFLQIFPEMLFLQIRTLPLLVILALKYQKNDLYVDCPGSIQEDADQ